MIESLVQFFTFFFSDVKTSVVSLVIGLLVYYLVRLYIQIRSLPPGPFPLPILGNLLEFRGAKVQQCFILEKLGNKYGPVFTLWVGPKPYVFIQDLDLAKEAFNKNEFTGRPDSVFGELVANDKFSDVIFADFGPQWMSLRRVAHNAVRKYSISETLPSLVRECVQNTVDLMLDREGIDRPFEAFEYVYHMFLNIMAASVFGKCYATDDPEFKKLNYIFHDFFNENSTRLTLIEFMPFMRYIDRSIVKKREQFMAETREMVKTKYISHYEDFNESSLRDLCDALIAAKNEALSEDKESAPYLNDDNLTMTLWDMFIGGVDTTHNTFKWILLLIASDHNIQNKLRQEIASEIGDRMPVHSDRDRCHYAMAFISEALRWRHIAALGVFHKAMVDSKIGQYSVSKGTAVFLNHYYIMHDKKHWSEPDRFIPERFLENDQYVANKNKAFIPFGIGRRICLGEKMAIIELFLVLVSFLQSTDRYVIDLDGEPDFEPNPVHSDGIHAKEFRILFKTQNSFSSSEL